MSREISITMWRELDDSELEITVTADYTGGTEDVPYLPNGDPGYPGNPPEIEITSAVDENGEDVELDEYETERALEKIQEAADDE